MNNFCNCEGFTKLLEQNRKLFVKDDTYGVVISWIELTEEKGYTQVHKYGIPVSFCPMCGKLLNKKLIV